MKKNYKKIILNFFRSGFLSAMLISTAISVTCAQQTGSFTKNFTFNSVTYPNQSRTIAYYVPANYTATKKYKLFISLGGQGWAIADDLISPYGPSSPGTVDLLKNPTYAATYGDFIAVSPSISPQAIAAGAPSGTWPYPAGADDGLPEAIIKVVSAAYNIDTNYVYLTGFSLGARGALSLGLNSYKKLRGLILFTPAVQGLKEAEDMDAYQSQIPAYSYLNYNNAPHIPICMTVGGSDPNGAGCSFCTPADPVASYATVIVPEIHNELLAAGAGSNTQFITVPGLAHNRPAASYMCGCYNFIEGLHVTGISSDEDKISEIKIFPNPSNGILSIQSSEIISSIEIINLLGEKIYSSKLNSDKTEMDLSKQQSGIYFVHVTSENGTATQKLIIQK